MKQCIKCGVRGGCKCLFTRTSDGYLCGLCTGKATLEKAAEIRHLRKKQGIEMANKKLVYSGWGNDEIHRFFKRYAIRHGYSYKWRGLKDHVFRTAEDIKFADLVAIWNGKQFTTSLVAELCRKRGIPHFFIEWGMLPQDGTYFVDPQGFCGDSILNDDLSWITNDDMQRLYRKRAQLQEKYPRHNESFILAPLQIHNDAQILYYSKYKTMNEFIDDVEAMYPNGRIVARPHPHGGNKGNHHFKRAEEIYEGDFLSWAARAHEVVAITSTCLYEAAILGVPVRAVGNHPFATHPRELHDKVAAGALALCVRRDGDLGKVLNRFDALVRYNTHHGYQGLHTATEKNYMAY